MKAKHDGKFTPAVVAIIVERDRGCCARCALRVTDGVRGFDWSIHHRQPRGMGGTSRRVTAADGIVLCGSGTTGCHGWVEKHREISLANGLLVSRNGKRVPAVVEIKHAVHGWVLLDDLGGWSPVRKEVA